MKIGLLGNMNNNNFALLRYFRDLGCDADLLLFSTDGMGYSGHFKPECDTWQIEKWTPYIHKNSIADDPISIFNFPTSYMLWARSVLRSIINRNQYVYHPVTEKKIFRLYSSYTHLIGSGLTPSLLYRAGLRLSIFFPYALGVEWLGDPVFLKKTKSANPITRFVARRVITQQTEAVKRAESIIYADRSLTEETLTRIGVKGISLFCPMVYNREVFPEVIDSPEVRNVIDRIDASDFSVLSHARHLWFRPDEISEPEWKGQDKNNDWLIRGFSKFVEKRIVDSPLLILFEYGEDLDHSKRLCQELNISEYVYWMPKIDRKHILYILSKVNVGVGEFTELPKILFGGTGYEVLASGKPLLQAFNFSTEEFIETFDAPPPPVLTVRRSDDILNHLVEMAKFPEKQISVGNKSREWFDQHCGIGLAKKWVEILKK